jgi:hypothetical protein
MYPEAVERFFPILVAVSLLWVLAGVLASVVHRRSKGKPILFHGVPDATFVETSASGHSNRTWYTRLGGASRCLVVAVTGGRVIIRPRFPFNLMFLPEIYGLEYEVPVTQIARIEQGRWGRVRVVFQHPEGTQDLTLVLRKPQEFIQAAGGAG